MPTNQELAAENERLNAEADELAAENERLTAELAEAKAAATTTNSVSFKDRTPTEPSYGLTEGSRAELQQRGHTISPFTGARLVADVSDDGKVSNVREVSAEEYDRMAREAAKQETAEPNKGMTFPKSA